VELGSSRGRKRALHPALAFCELAFHCMPKVYRPCAYAQCMAQHLTIPAKTRPHKRKAQKHPLPQVPLDAVSDDTSDVWNTRLKKARALAAERENDVANRTLIEASTASAACADVCRTVWLSALNLSQVIPARCAGASAETIRKEIIAELNAAKAKIDVYLAEIGK